MGNVPVMDEELQSLEQEARADLNRALRAVGNAQDTLDDAWPNRPYGSALGKKYRAFARAVRAAETAIRLAQEVIDADL